MDYINVGDRGRFCVTRKEQITTDDKQIGFYDKYQTETMDYEEFKSAIQCIINY